MPKKKDITVEFVDAGEMSQEAYEEVVEILTRLLVNHLNDQQRLD